MADEDYQVPFEFTGKLTQLMIAMDRRQLSPEDLKKLEAGQQAAHDQR